MAGLFFLKDAAWQGYAVIMLSVATYLYKVRMRALYASSTSVAHHLPMELAAAVDERRGDLDEAESEAALLEGLGAYVQPGLRET